MPGDALGQPVGAGVPDLVRTAQVHHPAQAQLAQRTEVFGGDVVQAVAAQGHSGPQQPSVGGPVTAEIAGIDRAAQTETPPDPLGPDRLRPTRFRRPISYAPDSPGLRLLIGHVGASIAYSDCHMAQRCPILHEPAQWTGEMCESVTRNDDSVGVPPAPLGPTVGNHL
ncbi:hypothetical protein GCM10018790_02370 [Kitasatospora xanthocidica]|nr:hypothetical protein GCM10018790_02370 [Kitasatospora xanthocidica]